MDSRPAVPGPKELSKGVGRWRRPHSCLNQSYPEAVLAVAGVSIAGLSAAGLSAAGLSAAGLSAAGLSAPDLSAAVLCSVMSRHPITSDVGRIRVRTSLWSLPEIAST